jgi:hypothetical protein
MNETLEKGSRRTLTTEYSLVPEFVVQAIVSHERDRPRP